MAAKDTDDQVIFQPLCHTIAQRLILFYRFPGACSNVLCRKQEDEMRRGQGRGLINCCNLHPMSRKSDLTPQQYLENTSRRLLLSTRGKTAFSGTVVLW